MREAHPVGLCPRCRSEKYGQGNVQIWWEEKVIMLKRPAGPQAIYSEVADICDEPANMSDEVPMFAIDKWTFGLRPGWTIQGVVVDTDYIGDARHGLGLKRRGLPEVL